MQQIKLLNIFWCDTKTLVYKIPLPVKTNTTVMIRHLSLYEEL